MNESSRTLDEEIILFVEEQLAQDESFASHGIDVEAQEGIVVLSGSVDSILARERALALVEAVKWVRAVVDQLNVNPIIRPNGEIKRDILRALQFDPAAQDYQIEVEVKEGIITLSGVVDSWQRKQLAAEVVKGVEGVRDVNSEIQIEYANVRSDELIRDDVERRLKQDTRIDRSRIEVQVEKGVVKLSGRTNSIAERRRASVSAWVPGVKVVDAEALIVEHRGRPLLRRENEAIHKPDEEVKDAVEDALRYDPRISASSVEVDVREGLVILTGVVDSLVAKEAATADARHTAGVWRVKNFLKVRPLLRPDDIELAENVRSALLWHPDIDRHQIIISCHGGQVRLNGQVNSQYEKSQAERVVSRVYGVVDIVNQLRVDQTVRWKSDRALQEDLERRLRWEPQVDLNEITVSVRDGVATLSGTVNTWHQRSLLVSAALEGGAKNVLSHLEVRESAGSDPTVTTAS